MPIDPVQFLTNLGLPQILLWLLTFAIMHGILSQVKTPKSNMARGLISLVIAFLVILAAPIALINLMAQMSGALVLVILGILIIIVFLEVAGAKAIAYVPTDKKDKDGKPIFEPKEFSIFERYGYLFAVAFFIIVALVFVSAGGLQLLGITAPAFDISSTGSVTILFFIIIIIAIAWMIANPE